jgi:hypothetical protein
MTTNTSELLDIDEAAALARKPVSTMRWLRAIGQGPVWEARPAREARRARGQATGRPKALDKSKAALAQRMHGSGESAATIAATLGVSRATVYRVLAEQSDDGD